MQGLYTTAQRAGDTAAPEGARGWAVPRAAREALPTAAWGGAAAPAHRPPWRRETPPHARPLWKSPSPPCLHSLALPGGAAIPAAGCRRLPGLKAQFGGSFLSHGSGRGTRGDGWGGGAARARPLGGKGAASARWGGGGSAPPDGHKAVGPSGALRPQSCAGWAGRRHPAPWWARPGLGGPRRVDSWDWKAISLVIILFLQFCGFFFFVAFWWTRGLERPPPALWGNGCGLRCARPSVGLCARSKALRAARRGWSQQVRTQVLK